MHFSLSVLTIVMILGIADSSSNSKRIQLSPKQLDLFKKFISNHSLQENFALDGNCTSIVWEDACAKENVSSSSSLTYSAVIAGFACVATISFISMVGVLIVPFMDAEIYHTCLTFMIALAIGSLSGSSIMHLIPQAFGFDPANLDHSYVYKAAMVLGGIYLFFFTEKLLKVLMSLRKLKSNDSTVPPICSMKGKSRHLDHHLDELPNASYSIKIDTQETNDSAFEDVSTDKSSALIINNFKKPKKSCCNNAEAMIDNIQNKPIATVAWMVIFGDGIHNFIDGLAIGAACSSSLLAGLSTSVAVICEELPHELGDFAILLHAGMTWKEAIFYNFLSALSCFLGLVIGLVLGEMTAAAEWIFALAGGMFLYISLVDMMPEMTDDSDEKGINLKRFLLQSVGLFTGWIVMLLFAVYGSKISFL